MLSSEYALFPDRFFRDDWVLAVMPFHRVERNRQRPTLQKAGRQTPYFACGMHVFSLDRVIFTRHAVRKMADHGRVWYFSVD